MSNGNPPVGAGYGFAHDNPAEPSEERRANRRQDRQDHIGEQDRALPNVPMDAEERVEQIVVREQGVNSFAHAEEVDRMERPPSVNDRNRSVDEGGNLISDTVKNAWTAIEDPDECEKDRG